MKNRNLPNKHEAKPKVKKALRRKLHFANNEIWTWEMRGRNISIRSPNGTIFKTDQSKIANVSRDELERASWKGYASQYAVTPSMVKDWINNQKEEK